MKTKRRYFKRKNPLKTLKMRNKRVSKNKNKNKNKIRKGGATINYSNKNVYVGEVTGEGDDEIPHGRGKMTFANGTTYEGDYFDGKMEGEGEMIFPSGLICKGQIKDNKFNGLVEMRFPSGLIYSGQIKDNKYHGEGKMIYPNGRIFTGKWYNNKIQPQLIVNKNRKKTKQITGTMTDSNGRNAVTGNWMNIDKPNPIILKKIENSIYEGEICLNKAKPHGSGKMTFDNGDVYEGNWHNGKMHGKGIYKSNDGKVFEGNWVNGERSKNGKMKLPTNAELGDDDYDDY